MITKTDELCHESHHADMQTGLHSASLRTIKRGALVGFRLAQAALEHVLFVRSSRGDSSARRRAWVQRTAKRLLKALNVRVHQHGFPPRCGLLVTNHLSYLDILVLASVAPGRFVAKSEVGSWPVFGWLAKCAGTIFIKRENRGDVGRVAEQMEQAMAAGETVILFPEGTSSNGRSVRPFRSSLLASVVRHEYPVSTAALDYHLTNGSVEEEVCYWGDMVLGPHLLNLLSKEGLQATLRFGESKSPAFTERKQLAMALHNDVVRLRTNTSDATSS